MVGEWSSDGEIALVVDKIDGRIVISCPPNDQNWIELSNAKIDGNRIQFVQKHFLHDGEFSPFNGVPCKCEIRLLDKDRLEFSIRTDSTGVESEILHRDLVSEHGKAKGVKYR
jgi:hypothetical protein